MVATMTIITAGGDSQLDLALSPELLLQHCFLSKNIKEPLAQNILDHLLPEFWRLFYIHYIIIACSIRPSIASSLLFSIFAMNTPAYGYVLTATRSHLGLSPAKSLPMIGKQKRDEKQLSHPLKILLSQYPLFVFHIQIQMLSTS